MLRQWCVVWVWSKGFGSSWEGWLILSLPHGCPSSWRKQSKHWLEVGCCTKSKMGWIVMLSLLGERRSVYPVQKETAFFVQLAYCFLAERITRKISDLLLSTMHFCILTTTLKWLETCDHNVVSLWLCLTYFSWKQKSKMWQQFHATVLSSDEEFEQQSGGTMTEILESTLQNEIRSTSKIGCYSGKHHS